MDSQELRSLMEAYGQVYEAKETTALGGRLIDPYDKEPYSDDRHPAGDSYKPVRRLKKQSGVIRKEETEELAEGGASKKAETEFHLNLDKLVHKTFGSSPEEMKKEKVKKEEVDIFDIVLEFLCVEGYAETLEEAEWMMANILDEEAVDIILGEAEGSYGQTPKARAAMGKVAIARREKPASEYSQKGEKTKKVREIEKHTRRIDNGPDAGDRGKKSTKPRWSGYAGKSGRGKLDQDSRDASREDAVEYSAGGHKQGPGTVTKNPKKLRKQKAMGEIGEAVEKIDEIMKHQQERDRIEGNKAREADRVKKARSAYGKLSQYSPPTKGVHGEIERRQAQRPPSRLRSGSLPEEFVDEAQHARENPEQYEREQAKKSAPVRGERTPMPPRGDKRREDFEKWYAKNVREEMTPEQKKARAARLDYKDEVRAARRAWIKRANKGRPEYEGVKEAYQEPKFSRKDYLAKLQKRGGMGMGTKEDPHGYRDPKMAKVGAEFSKRVTAAHKAKKSGEADEYRAEKEAQSKKK